MWDLKSHARKGLRVQVSLRLPFKINYYEFSNFHVRGKTIIKNYGEQLSDEEINQILKAEAERHLKAIEGKIKQK